MPSGSTRRRQLRPRRASRALGAEQEIRRKEKIDVGVAESEREMESGSWSARAGCSVPYGHTSRALGAVDEIRERR